MATKPLLRLGFRVEVDELPGEANGEACDGCPPIERLFQQFTDGGGELWLCPICINARGLAIPEFRDRVAEPVVYDSETAEQRIERRKQRWTPTDLTFID